MTELFNDCWFLTGATATGKTAVGIALAQQIGAEVHFARFDDYLSRNGYRHRKAVARRAGSRAASSHRYRRPERGIQRCPICRCGRGHGRRHSLARQGTAVRRRHAAVSQKPAPWPVRRAARRLANAAARSSKSSNKSASRRSTIDWCRSIRLPHRTFIRTIRGG